MLPSFPYGKHCFQCLYLVLRCKLCLRYTAGNFNENPGMRALAKILRARAIRAKTKFCEHFQIGWDHSISLNVPFADVIVSLPNGSIETDLYVHQTSEIITNTLVHHAIPIQKEAITFSLALRIRRICSSTSIHTSPYANFIDTPRKRK